jgi:peroxiredoxin
MQRTTRLFAIVGIFGVCSFINVVCHADQTVEQVLGTEKPAAISVEPLKVGDLAPEFECLDDHLNLWNSPEHVGNKYLVLFFYKSDFSFCCERQAKLYRDRMDDLTDLCAEVVGISGDSVKSHAKYASTRQLTFPLLSDRSGKVATLFGVPFRHGGKAMETDAKGNTVFDCLGKAICHPRDITLEHRCTFIIDTNGVVIHRADTESPMTDALMVIDFIKAWNANPRQ